MLFEKINIIGKNANRIGCKKDNCEN